MSAGPGRPPFARKRFGQHFLHDPGVLDRIARTVAARPGDRVVEIGPGRGALTEHLLAATGGVLDAVEIDRDLAALLRERHAGEPGFTLHEHDALEFDFAALAQARGGPLRVVGNLPYNISSPLLFHLLARPESIRDLHVMLQREVVERMAAAPGEREYGRLAVMLAPVVRVEHLFDVGPGAFQPPPQVWSSVVRLTVLAEPPFAAAPRYAELVAAAFGQRRKTLRNSLRALLSAEQIAACGVDPGLRPERLPPESFNRLALAAAGTG
jgi:16S rRNA (adenine1518-N6/adenine1519-N6)-dimethyltransferase